jgi:hypothetical protein
MPLLPGKSKAAFSTNVATEVDAGKARGMSKDKAVKRAVAIAYSERRRAGHKQTFHEGLK